MYKVIIVDDESVIIEGLTETVDWKVLNCEVVTTANDGLSGVEAARLYRPDIVITDIKMPNMDGISMIRNIKEFAPSTQFIIMTGFRKFEYAYDAVNAGVVRMIVKPASMEEIVEAVNATIKIIDSKPKDINANDDVYDIQGNYNHLVDRVVTYMKLNFYEKITLSTVAERFFVSNWHLCRVLKKETGRSFVDILNGIRIAKAKEFLRNTNLKVYEIARQVGYRELTYFSNMFKKTTGYTPNEYRNSKVVD